MTPDDRDRLHLTALRRTAREPHLIGSIFDAHAAAEGLAPRELADRLGVSLGKLAWLALCQVPGEEQFAEYVAYLARRSGARLPALGALLRRRQFVADAQRDPAPSEAGVAGMLLAAHDADQRPDGGEPGAAQPQ